MSKSDILANEIARDFRKGLLKFFILKMLNREDMHGYAMMGRIEEVCGWKPSSGSMYPALLNLTTQGLIKIKVTDMRKIYLITPKGKQLVAALDQNLDFGLKEIGRMFNEI
ncbi:MAG: PadR family transcriptional regulator [Thermoplasmata archaeon]|nr:PadR family transcriptional regulator [Thermoplasmata archaeon]